MYLYRARCPISDVGRTQVPHHRLHQQCGKHQAYAARQQVSEVIGCFSNSTTQLHIAWSFASSAGCNRQKLASISFSRDMFIPKPSCRNTTISVIFREYKNKSS